MTDAKALMSPLKARVQNDLTQDLSLSVILQPKRWLPVGLSVLLIVLAFIARISSHLVFRIGKLQNLIQRQRELLSEDQPSSRPMGCSAELLDEKAAALDDRRRCMLNENNYVDADEIPQKVIDEWMSLLTERDRCLKLKFTEVYVSSIRNDLSNVLACLQSFMKLYGPNYQDILLRDNTSMLSSANLRHLLQAYLAVAACCQSLKKLPASTFLSSAEKAHVAESVNELIEVEVDLATESSSGISAESKANDAVSVNAVDVLPHAHTAAAETPPDEIAAQSLKVVEAVEEIQVQQKDCPPPALPLPRIEHVAAELVLNNDAAENVYFMPDEMPHRPVATSTPSKKIIAHRALISEQTVGPKFLAADLPKPTIHVEPENVYCMPDEMPNYPVASSTPSKSANTRHVSQHSVESEVFAAKTSMSEQIAASLLTLPFGPFDNAFGDQPSICPTESSMNFGTNSYLTCADSFRDDSMFSNSQFGSIIHGSNSAAGTRFGVVRRNQFSQQPMHLMHNGKRMAQNLRPVPNNNGAAAGGVQKNSLVPFSSNGADDVDVGNLSRMKFEQDKVRIMSDANPKSDNVFQAGKRARTADDSID